jgi:hypothetical protein
LRQVGAFSWLPHPIKLNTDNCNYILMLKLSILPFSHLTSPSEIESAKAGVEII